MYSMIMLHYKEGGISDNKLFSIINDKINNKNELFFFWEEL